MKPQDAIPFDVKLMHLVTLALVLVFAVLSGVYAVRWMARSPVFDLKLISVVGQVTHNNALTLRANVAHRMGGTFFTVDLQRVRAAFEAAPWVRRAVVHRSFPNRLKVVLQEHQAVAYWGQEGDSRLLNSYGEVFEANVGEVEQEMLPRLNGPEEKSAEVLAMQQVVFPLFAQAGLNVDRLELSARGSWSVHLDQGADIALGRGDVAQVQERLQRFLKTLTQVTTRFGRNFDAIESADLRHENGYALRLQGVGTMAAIQ